MEYLVKEIPAMSKLFLVSVRGAHDGVSDKGGENGTTSKTAFTMIKWSDRETDFL